MVRKKRLKRARKFNRTVVVIDDDRSLRDALSRYLARSHKVLTAASCRDALALLDEAPPIDVLLVDIRLPDGQGFELADRASSLSPKPGVIMMTGDDRMDNAIKALHHGASDFLLKPFSLEALEAAIERVCRWPSVASAPGDEQVRKLPPAQWRDRYCPELCGTDPKLLDAIGIVQRVADTDVTVLITGESGTGKELFARALRAGAGTRTGPFVTVNCAAIPDALLESELFGHTRGAFTGAVDDREGRFALADGGTVFLDEVGDLAFMLQAKILRVLQEKEISPVGSSVARKVDVRVIAATNRDLGQMVSSGEFREDLYYRLSIIPIEVPPLRERRGDIPTLVHRFCGLANERRARQIQGISEDALGRLVAYDWPGNVRQLENTLERMVVLRSEGQLTVDDLPAKIKAVKPENALWGDAPALPPEGLDLCKAVEVFENALIIQALDRTGWNKKQAAAVLRMNRTTLVEKLKKKKLTPPKTPGQPSRTKRAASRQRRK